MIAVHLEKGRVSVRERPMPEVPEGFARIRLLLGGICNTDLELQRGYYGFEGTPGHEFVGEVVEAGKPELVGKRVVGDINIPCYGKECLQCLSGFFRHCPDRMVLGIVKHPGAFSEFFTLPVRNLHIVPDSIPSEHAVFAEPLAAAHHIVEQVSFNPGSAFAVLGDGKLGLLIAQVLKANEARVYQFGHHWNKLKISEAAGVMTQVVGDRLPIAEFDFVVEATGTAQGLASAIAMARPKGVVFMKSTFHGLVPINTASIVVDELILVGSRCGRMEPALKLLEEGKINVGALISETYPLADAPKAFERAATRGVLKVLLDNRL